jgi:signal transduction histidine kinase
MRLRTRIVLTLLLMIGILSVPAAYGLSALRDLQQIARSLRYRTAQASLTLGRLQTSIEEVKTHQSTWVVMRGEFPTTSLEVRPSLDSASARTDGHFRFLREAGFGEATREAEARWKRIQGWHEEERRILDARQLVGEDASDWRQAHIFPRYDSLDASLDRVAVAIDAVGRRDVIRAQHIADRGVQGALMALAVALAVTVTIGAWLTRGLLRPIHQLQHGMAKVAEGDFEPDVQIPRARADEIGDLARSFDRMTEQLTELDRLKAEFVSIASHELKTPLSVIRGYASLLLDGIYGEMSETQTKTLNSVADQADRLARLVHRLLDVSRFEAGGGRLELRPVDLRAFLADLASGFEVLAIQSGIDFRVDIDAGLPERLVADPDRLNEVLGNILSNAFKFTPKGGRIELSARRDGRRADGVVVEVQDSGVGIPADKLPHIFEKFFQVENDAQPRSVGSGLGLAIAREIVEAHGGTIGAASEPGRGTRFIVTLPERPPHGHVHS